MDDFWRTLLATVAGSVVAVLGAWIIFSRESKERYAVRLNDALASVITAIPPHLAAMADVEQQLRQDSKKPSWPPIQRQWPAADGIGLALIAAGLVARGEDRDIVDAAHEAFQAVVPLRSDHERAGLLLIATLLGDWRSKRAKDDVAAAFKDMVAKSATDHSAG